MKDNAGLTTPLEVSLDRDQWDRFYRGNGYGYRRDLRDETQEVVNSGGLYHRIRIDTTNNERRGLTLSVQDDVSDT